MYDILLDCFYEWGHWNTATNEYDMFKGRGYTYAKPWGQHLIGDNTTGKVYLMSPNYKDDDGDPIKALFEFGRKDHGTKSYKLSNSLYLDIRRGDGLAATPHTAAKVQLYWRDNGEKAYGNFVEISLGKLGEYALPPRLSRLGRYRDRQYKIVAGGYC